MKTRQTRIEDHTKALAGLTATHRQLTSERDKTKAELSALDEAADCAEQAREIINEVLKATQEEVVGLVSELVSLALAAVYGPDHSFELEFDIRRNQSEATPWIVRDGERFSPREEVGGGVLDICSLALRLALWSLNTPRTAPLFVLDEPVKWLSADRQESFGRLLKEVSERLGVQIVLVTHSSRIIGMSDKTYEVRLEKGISKVRLLD